MKNMKRMEAISFRKELHALHVLPVTLFVTCIAASVLVAQSQQQPPQFRAGVDVFQLEVTVLDRNHDPVRGLKASKFSVLENGKPQKIVSFDEVEVPEYDGPLTTAVEDNAPDVAMPRYADRWLIALVLDDFNW